MQAAARSLSHFKFNNRRCAGLLWALFCGLTFFSDLLHFGTALLKGLYAVAVVRVPPAISAGRPVLATGPPINGGARGGGVTQPGLAVLAQEIK